VVADADEAVRVSQVHPDGELRQDGQPVRDEDAARLSPLGHAHLNCLGRYAFTTRNPPSGLRPLRDPSAPADSDEGW
jgi:Tn3 transposase DDE domain